LEDTLPNSLEIAQENTLENKSFILQRISIYTNKDFDPCNDEDVMVTLRNDLNIHLPQRSSLNDSLAAAASDHEIIQLIWKYRQFSSK
jgi:hypothetical protein